MICCLFQNSIDSLYTMYMAQEPAFTDNKEFLVELSKKYLWWEDPAKVQPYRILAAAMNLGSLEDYQRLYRTFGPSLLGTVIQKQVPGWFSAHSWSFWHRVLDLVDVCDAPPSLPKRLFP